MHLFHAISERSLLLARDEQHGHSVPSWHSGGGKQAMWQPGHADRHANIATDMPCRLGNMGIQVDIPVGYHGMMGLGCMGARPSVYAMVVALRMFAWLARELA